MDRYIIKLFGLERDGLGQRSYAVLTEPVRNVARHLPAYVTMKDVKYCWRQGQEDMYPVAQVDNLWSDMGAFKGVQGGYVIVPRFRGQQLKAPVQ
jgi:hypothetical protein